MVDAFFQYDIEITHGRNPRGTKDWFQESLREWFVRRGLDYGMGAMGGPHVYGTVGTQPPATEADRRDLAAWVACQRIDATVRLGPITPNEPDLLTPITDWVFAVDNLTAEEKAAALAYDVEIRQKVAALRRKQAESNK
jgi:hypothetical protein